MQKKRVRVLLIEDSHDDAALIAREIKRGFDADVRRVDTRAAFVEAIQHHEWDVILSDFTLPGYDGLTALEDAFAAGLSTPFIILSGSISEETAVATMRAGAKDYILKDRLVRLTPAIERELKDASRHSRSEAKFRALLESAPDAMVIVREDGVMTLVNAQVEKLFGYERSELIGRRVDILIHERDRAEHEQHLMTFFRNPTAGQMAMGVELAGVHQRGTEIPIEIRFGPIDTAEGLLVCSAIRELTERKRAEAQLRRAETHLQQTQKMEAIGSLAGGVAHDFNNLLSIILSYSEFVLHALPSTDPIRADIEEVHRAGERAASLTRQLLAFGRQQMLRPQVLDIDELIAGIVGMLKRVLGEDIELTLLTKPKTGAISADPSQVEQVIMNLVVNARDAMPMGGRLLIETKNVDLDTDCEREHPDATSGPYVMIAVTDTGHGIDAATRERIFEPFFTTKEQGKGTGLGLSTVFGIVKQSKGHIWLHSEIGKGTTFNVYFPRVDRATAPPHAPSAPPVTRLLGTETILLVEDEDAVRALARSILRRSGYTVLEAQNGGEAFLICEQYPAKIDLLLTDVIMPRMSGDLVAKRVAPLRPSMKVLFMSGYADTSIVHHGVLDSGVALLQKPITPEALLRKVREILDS